MNTTELLSQTSYQVGALQTIIRDQGQKLGMSEQAIEAMLQRVELDALKFATKSR